MHEGNKKWVILIEAILALGKILSAFYIYAGKSHYAR